MLKHEVKEVTLKNGAKGLFIDVPDASVMSFRINFRAGDIYMPDETKWETAHIMEHLSLGANKRFKSSRDYQAELDKNGAYSNAMTSQTDMTYEAECADFEWERFADLFTLGISQPLFLQSEFEAECGNVYEEIIGRGNNHGGRLSIEMAKKYGLKLKTFQERADLMKNVTLDDIKAHYKHTHFAANMRFVISGNMKGRTTKLRSLLENMSLPKSTKTERFTIPRELPKSFDEPLFVPNETVPNAYFYIDSYANCELSLSELYSLNLLGTILTDTMYSRIFGEARTLGLIYYLQSSYYRNEAYSSWWFGSQISEKQLKPFLEIFVKELARVKAGEISEEDIEAAKMNQLGGFQRDAQTVNALTNGYSGMYFYNGEIEDYYKNFNATLKKVTKKTMVEVANKMFESNVWGIGFLGTISEKARLSAQKQISNLWAN
jgi:predicted Zn-dependent peptidase